jgi:hypothetical protein
MEVPCLVRKAENGESHNKATTGKQLDKKGMERLTTRNATSKWRGL